MEAKSIIDRSDARPSRSTEAQADPRPALHAMWAGVAGAWDAHAAFIDARGAEVAERMLERAAPRPGERVLELAGGPGGVGLAAAGLVAPGGEVTVSDVAAEMTAIAAARARALGLENVTTRVLDLERIDAPDAACDVVLCREGLMLVPDPAAAAREVRRVLRPGGRVALTVWGPRAENPWLGVVFDAVSAKIGAPMPPPGAPHPFSLEDAARVAALLSDAGLDEVAVEEVPTPYHADSVEEWWARTAALAGPLARMLAALPADAAASLRARARAGIAAYATPAGTLEIPGVSLLASGSRAG